MTTIENKFVQKLIADLAIEGIIFSIDQEEVDIIGFEGNIIGKRKLENVIFEKDSNQLKIYNGIFFRWGGLSHIFQEVKKGEYHKAVIVTDEIFYQMQKASILYRFSKIYE
jgi:hypothetical protein